MIADLHMHSSCSDGTDSPSELIEKIKKRGISVFSVTDHDTVDALKYIKEEDIRDLKYIVGVEMTCFDRFPCHILGFGFDPENEVISSLLNKGSELRRQKLIRRLDGLSKMFGFEFTDEERKELTEQKGVGKLHIAALCVKKGYANDIGSTIKTYINKFECADIRLSAQEVIQGIHKAGGLAVWAHPFGEEGKKETPQEDIPLYLKRLFELGIDGVECYYSKYDFNKIAFLKSLADKYGLYISAGSDYHGKNKQIPLGKTNSEEKPVNIEEITVLTALLK